jgi:hypothetical protein
MAEEIKGECSGVKTMKIKPAKLPEELKKKQAEKKEKKK